MAACRLAAGAGKQAKNSTSADLVQSCQWAEHMPIFYSPCLSPVDSFLPCQQSVTSLGAAAHTHDLYMLHKVAAGHERDLLHTLYSDKGCWMCAGSGLLCAPRWLKLQRQKKMACCICSFALTSLLHCKIDSKEQRLGSGPVLLAKHQSPRHPSICWGLSTCLLCAYVQLHLFSCLCTCVLVCSCFRSSNINADQLHLLSNALYGLWAALIETMAVQGCSKSKAA